MVYYERLHTKRITLEDALKDGPLYIPTVCDCFTSMIAEDVGYRAMLLGGEEFSGYYAGIPDVGLITPTELRLMEGQISKVTNIPMIVDLGNGFGNEMNAIRAAIDLVEAGASAVVLNDQVFPNRYGSDNQSRYLSRAGFANKLRAVADALVGSGCTLIARVDCAEALGLDEAIARCNGAYQAGAGITAIRGLRDRAEAEKFARQVAGRKLFELPRDLSLREIGFDALTEKGYCIVVCPTFVDAAYSAYGKQLQKAFESKNDFFVNPVDLINGTERREFLGLNKWLELGKRYNDEIVTASKTKALD